MHANAWSFARPRVVLLSTLAAACLAAAGCATGSGGGTTAPAAKAGPAAVAIESGFLADYSKLTPSDQFADLRLYRDLDLVGGYSKILFRPIQVWRSADKQLDDIPDSDLQFLADSFYRAVVEPLRAKFQLVDKPGPGVLEISLALTLVTDARGKVDFFSTNVPVPELLSRTQPMGEATRAFVHDCALEAEFAESLPPAPGKKPKRLVKAAIFDTRKGTETPKGQVKSWEDLDAVFQKWAGVLVDQLDALRSGTFQPKFTTGGKKAAK